MADVPAEKVVWKSPTVWLLCGLVALGTLNYAQVTGAISDLQKGQQEVVKSVDQVRDEVRKLIVDQVAVRQATQWIELFRALNRAKYPELVIPDLPR